MPRCAYWRDSYFGRRSNEGRFLKSLPWVCLRCIAARCDDHWILRSLIFLSVKSHKIFRSFLYAKYFSKNCFKNMDFSHFDLAPCPIPPAYSACYRYCKKAKTEALFCTCAFCCSLRCDGEKGSPRRWGLVT